MICCFNCGANEMVEIEWIKMLHNEETFRAYKTRVGYSWEWCKVPLLIKSCTHNTAFWDTIPLYPPSAAFFASHKKSDCTNNTGSSVTETGDSLKLLFVTREKREREQLGSFPWDRHSCYLQLVVVFKYSHI